DQSLLNSLLAFFSMMLILLALAALFLQNVSSEVFTCNEIKLYGILVNTTQVCVVIPAGINVKEEPYLSNLNNTVLVDTSNNEVYGLSEMNTDDNAFCINGVGPWTVISEVPDQFACSSDIYAYAEMIFIFSSEQLNITRTSKAPTLGTYGQGSHTFVAPEGSLLIGKVSSTDEETTLQFYTGAGAAGEECFPLMPEKFIAGTSTVILGPVTTLKIEDDITVELVATAFDDRLFISADPGYEFTLMTSGLANDIQSTRNILVSTAYGINNDAILYDSISITGTIKLDSDVGTVLSIECYHPDEGGKTSEIITQTRDLIMNHNCTSLDITYIGNLDVDRIYRSSEVIYLRISSNSDPILKPATPDGPVTAGPDVTKPLTSRRTTLPRTAPTKAPMSSTDKDSIISTTIAPTTTTSDVETVAIIIS
ncbi:hypothetical protein PFISCL1PPCAC_7639, partial [Pristionchus fissidentatus]